MRYRIANLVPCSSTQYLLQRKFAVMALAALIASLTINQTVGAAVVNTKISGIMPAGSYVSEFQISPDSTRVVYEVSRKKDGTLEAVDLFSVPINGGTPIRLSNSLPSGWVVDGFYLSPDSHYVVYRADPLSENTRVQELYSVPISGGTETRLGAAYFRAGFDTIQISPDSRRVVYLTPEPTIGAFELHSVPIDGGVVTKLNGPLTSGGTVRGFHISPDGSHVVYQADQDTAAVIELYSVPIDGGTEIKLNIPLVGEEDVGSFQISPDGSRVVYTAGDRRAGVVELFSVPTGGGTTTKLNAPLVDDRVVWDFQINSDGHHIVYSIDRDNGGIGELYSVPVDGGTATKLNGPIAGLVGVTSFQISPDGNRVVHQSDEHGPFRIDLYSVSIDGGAVTKLNGSPTGDGDVGRFQISPDGSRVVYIANLPYNVYHLYSVPTGGGIVTQLDDPLIRSRAEWDFRISPDSHRVVYMAYSSTGDRTVYAPELYSVPVSGGEAVKINGPLVSGGEIIHSRWIQGFAISPDGRRVVYRADQEIDGVFELFVSFEGSQVRLPVIMR